MSIEKTHIPRWTRGLLIPRPNILPANGRPSDLDAVRVMESLPHWGPVSCIVQVSSLMWEYGRLPRVPPCEGRRLRFKRSRRATCASMARWRSFWDRASVS